MSIANRINSTSAWPGIETNAGTFDARSYERDDGFRSVCFTPPGTEVAPQQVFGGSTRVAYRIVEGRGILLGLYLADELKGSGLATELTRYFMDTIEPIEGVPFVGTGKVHKPLVALTFMAAGLAPASDDYLVEVLPRSTSDTSHIPKVAVVRNNLPSDEAIVTANGPNTFYDVVNDGEVRLKYPLGTPEKTVALHTCYVPTEPQA